MEKTVKARTDMVPEAKLAPFSPDQEKALGALIDNAIHAGLAMAYKAMEAVADDCAKRISSGEINAMQAFGMMAMSFRAIGEREAKHLPDGGDGK